MHEVKCLWVSSCAWKGFSDLLQQDGGASSPTYCTLHMAPAERFAEEEESELRFHPFWCGSCHGDECRWCTVLYSVLYSFPLFAPPTTTTSFLSLSLYSVAQPPLCSAICILQHQLLFLRINRTAGGWWWWCSHSEKSETN